MFERRALFTLLLCAAGALGACSSKGAGPADAGDGVDPDAALFSCATETRAVDYAPNLTRTSTSGAYKATLTTADPAPWVKGNNSWTVQVFDAAEGGAGEPLDGLSMTATTFMPDHQHGSSLIPVVTGTGGGSYTVTPLYLFMAGFWQISLVIQPDAGPQDKIVFPICVQG